MNKDTETQHLLKLLQAGVDNQKKLTTALPATTISAKVKSAKPGKN